MLRCRVLVSLFTCSFLLLGSIATAQIDTGVIVGRVVDDSGAVLPGVTVTATQHGDDDFLRKRADVQLQIDLGARLGHGPRLDGDDQRARRIHLSGPARRRV